MHETHSVNNKNALSSVKFGISVTVSNINEQIRVNMCFITSSEGSTCMQSGNKCKSAKKNGFFEKNVYN